MAESLSLISTILYGAAVLFLILSVFFFFFFRIPSVIGDLSGRTARKSIAKNRLLNEKGGSKSYRPSETNKARGKLTDSIADSSPTPGQSKASAGTKNRQEKDRKKELTFAAMDDRPETGLLNENRGSSNAGDEKETSALDAGETSSLWQTEEDGSATTDLLDAAPPQAKAFSRSGGVKLTILDQVILIHTEEDIN